MIAFEHAGRRERLLINLTQRIREEFERLPCLRVSRREAAQFWALDEEEGETVLARLLAAGFLARGGDGRYRMA